jgi:hypothetical protein
VTERAVRAGLANAASGKIMVSIPNDHFGPIEAKHDPSRNRVGHTAHLQQHACFGFASKGKLQHG